MLNHGIPLAFRDGVYMYRQPPSSQSRAYRVTYLRTDGVHCRDPAVTGLLLVLKAVLFENVCYARPGKVIAVIRLGVDMHYTILEIIPF